MGSLLSWETRVISVGQNKPLQPAQTLAELTLLIIADRVASALPGLLTSTSVIESRTNTTVDHLWPLHSSFGSIEVRGHKATGLYVFDTKSGTITGSPVADVLDAARDSSGNTYVFVYGNVRGGENDDRYAWISTKDGSLLPGTINDEPARKLPEGLVALPA